MQEHIFLSKIPFSQTKKYVPAVLARAGNSKVNLSLEDRISAAKAMASGNTDPDYEKVLVSTVTQDYTREKAIKDANERDAKEVVFRTLMQGKTLKDVPPETWSKMDYTDAYKMQHELSQNKQTNWNWYMMAMALPVEERAKIPIEVAMANLDKEKLNEWGKMTVDFNAGVYQDNQGLTQDQRRYVTDMVVSVGLDAGLRNGVPSNKDDWDRANLAMQVIDQKVRESRKNGTPMNDKEIKTFIDNQFVKVRLGGTKFLDTTWGGDKVYNFEANGKKSDKTEVLEVPALDTASAEKRIRDAGLTPDDAATKNIAAAWSNRYNDPSGSRDIILREMQRLQKAKK